MTYKLPNDGSAYAFVTREDIKKWWDENMLFPSKRNPLFSFVEKLLAEREAYREVAITNHWTHHMGLKCIWGAAAEQCVDAEAARLLEGKK